MRRSVKAGIWIIGCIAFALVVYVTASRILVSPPISALEEALRAFSGASSAAGTDTVVAELVTARQYLEAGQQVMREASDDLLPHLSYGHADSLFRQSTQMSILAESLISERQTRFRDQTLSDLARLTDSLAHWRQLLDNLLPRQGDEISYKTAEFWGKMALELSSAGQYRLSVAYMDTSRSWLDSLENSLRQQQLARERRGSIWQKWINEVIDSSRASGRSAVIVSKADHLLFLVESGELTGTFPCDLGYNSGHQKRRAGDGATPEGVYRVTRINNSSKYYRAALIDYPNREDRARFASDLKSDAIPPTSSIGGLIEIHGDGGKGRDWTDGCVALSNSDMDKLLRVVRVGTLVAIAREWERRR